MERDNPGNILGANNADNCYDSSSATANADGSILEILKNIQTLVVAVTAGQVILQGAADAGANSTTIIPVAGLAGYGNDFFNNQFYVQVLCNKNSAGAAPEKEVRKITDYVSSSGTFTCDAFSSAVEATDICLIVHESQIAIGRNDNNNVYDSSTAVANANGSLIEMIKDLKAGITTLSGYVDLEVAAIQAVTDNLPDAGALTSLINAMTTIDNFIDGANLEMLTGAADGGTHSYPDSIAQDSVFAYLMSKADPAVKTSYDNTTDSLEAISDKVDAIDDYIDGAALEKLTGVADGGSHAYPDSVVQESVIAYMLSKSANPVTTSYDNTTDSMEALSDAIAYIKNNLVVATGTFTTSSATIPADTTLGAAKTTNDYYKGCILMPLTGDCAFQPRKIVGYTGTTGVLTLDTETPFTAAPGAVSYVILAAVKDTGLNTIVPATPTAGSLNDILSKAAGGNTFDKATDSLEALAEAIAYIKANQVVATGTFTTDSATVPADTTLGAAKTTNNYYNGCLLMPLTGACAFQPRRIKTYTGTTGVLALETETPFTAAPGAVTYVILSDAAITGFNTIVPASPTAGSLYDILSIAAGGNTFDKSTDSLEAISNKVTNAHAQVTLGTGLYLSGTCTTGASTTAIAATELIGYGDGYFANKYYMQVIKDSAGGGAAPELQIRKITAYTSTTGAFTCDAFANNVDAGDELAIIHESIVMLGRNDADNVIDTSTVAANEDGSLPERMEQMQEAINKGSGLALGSNRSIINEIRGSALNYNSCNYLAVTVDLSEAAWNEIATQTVFAVTGLCRLRILVEITENCSSVDAGGTMKLGYTGATGDIIAATSIDAMAAGELWKDNSPTETYGTFTDVLFDRYSNGIDVGFEIETKAALDGTIVFHCWWEPLNATGAVVAGTGQALA